MGEVIPPLPNTPSWRGTQLGGAQGQLYFTFTLRYDGVTKRFRTESVTKYTLTAINTSWEATKRVRAAKLTRLTHKIMLQLHLVADSCTICSSCSRRPVRKLLDTPSYVMVENVLNALLQRSRHCELFLTCFFHVHIHFRATVCETGLENYFSGIVDLATQDRV
jgi:hypothetical protein